MIEKKVVVTGASGHIGFHVAVHLISLGYKVTLLIRKENQNVTILKNLGAAIVTVDFSNSNSFSSVLNEADALFHLASQNTTDTYNEESVVSNTFQLTKLIIDTAVACNVKTVVYTSSVVVLGRSSTPDVLVNENDKTTSFESPYVKGKFLAEAYVNRLVKEKKVDIRIVYPSWVLGSNDLKLTPPHKLIKNYLQKGQSFYFKGGISITSVEEVARAHVSAWLIGKPSSKYILAGHNISFKEFYLLLAKHTGRKPPFIFLPKWMMLTAAYFSKAILGRKTLIDPVYVKAVIGNYSWYDSRLAIEELDYIIPKPDDIINSAVIGLKRKIIGLDRLVDKRNHAVERVEYKPDNVLLITGFPGWLGIRLVDILINADRFGNNAINRKIKLLVQPKFQFIIPLLPANFQVVFGDVTDYSTLKNALKDVKAVYHLAGVVYPKKIKSYYKVNYEGTKNLVDACIENGVRRILFMSSDSICGYGRGEKIFDKKSSAHPYKHYGKSKYQAENYILDKTKEGLIDGTSLRGFWFFGPYPPPRNFGFLKMFFYRRQIVFGDGKNFRSISHLDNITEAFIKAETSKAAIGKWYWIANAEAGVTVDKIYQNIAASLKVTYKPLYIPKLVCELINILDSIINFTGRVNSTIHAAGKFHKNIAGDITDATQDFDYKSMVGFEQIKEEISEELSLFTKGS